MKFDSSDNFHYDPMFYESMTCINNCGMMLVWHRSSNEDVWAVMNEHLGKCPNALQYKKRRWWL